MFQTDEKLQDKTCAEILVIQNILRCYITNRLTRQRFQVNINSTSKKQKNARRMKFFTLRVNRVILEKWQSNHYFEKLCWNAYLVV